MGSATFAARSTRWHLHRIDRLEIKLSLAFHKEHTVRGLIAARRVAVVPTRLHEVRPGSQPEFGLSFRGLNVRPRQDHHLHVVGVRVERSCESRGQLEKRAIRAVRMVTPQIRNLDSRGPGPRSVHFTSLAGITTSRLAAAFEALFAFASPDACAKTAAGRANVIPSVRTVLALIEPSLPLDSLAEDAAASSRPSQGDVLYVRQVTVEKCQGSPAPWSPPKGNSTGRLYVHRAVCPHLRANGADPWPPRLAWSP